MSEETGLLHEHGPDGIVRITFDNPGDRPNLLTTDLLRRLERLVVGIHDRPDTRAVMFKSACPGVFISGFDLAELSDSEAAYRAAEAARFGQEVFRRISSLSLPTACAIGGVCLGAGLELALACTFRVAAGEAGISFGLTETRLGLLPAFGGTQRLPRLIGLQPALELIPRGRRVDAARAYRLGLVDRLVPESVLEAETAAMLLAEVEKPDSVKRQAGSGRNISDRAKEKVPAYRRMLVAAERKKLAETIDQADYPAPFRALEAVEAASTMPLAQGLDLEARLVGELAPTRTARNLSWLYRSRLAIRATGPGVRVLPRKIGRVAVIGAGRIGGGVGGLFADRELPVRLVDLKYGAALEAIGRAHDLFQAQVRAGKMPERAVDWKLGYLSPAADYSGVSRADLVIEAVPEDLETKRKVLADLEERLHERAVVACSPSAIPIQRIAAGALRPERVVGLHFFHPADKVQLVEIVAAPRSSPEALATARAVALRLGKTPVEVKDSPGFLVNRIMAAYLMEAIRLMGEGNRIDTTDAAMGAFGMKPGPFTLIDRVGLATVSCLLSVLQAELPERFDNQAGILDTLVSAGRTGRTSGAGFYRYRQEKKGIPDKETYNLAGIGRFSDIPPETLQERMVLAMINEAAACLQEEVVASPSELDLAMVLGAGFPPFRGGVLRHADAIGVAMVSDRLSRLADSHGDRFMPVSLLDDMVRRQERFYSAG